MLNTLSEPTMLARNGSASEAHTLRARTLLSRLNISVEGQVSWTESMKLEESGRITALPAGKAPRRVKKFTLTASAQVCK